MTGIRRPADERQFLRRLMRETIPNFRAGRINFLQLASDVESIAIGFGATTGSDASRYDSDVYRLAMDLELLSATLHIEGRQELTEQERELVDRTLDGVLASIAGEPGDDVDKATVVLYRPVGPKELALIRDSGFRAFPPRLPEQPIFYPVLNEEYATKIARDWNSTSAQNGYAGFVTRFEVRAAFLAGYPIKIVGSWVHQEYWIPAEDLDDFNANIVGPIEVIAEYRRGQHVP